MEMVNILLSTYNRAEFILQQLETIFNQSYDDWRLLIRDDASNDGTHRLLDDFSSSNTDRVKILRDDLGTLGAVGNFSRLLSVCDSRYIMFCDQDDVWLPDKVKKTYETMLAAEKKFGTETPLLVHTDLCVVDRDLRMIAPSFCKYQHVNPRLGMYLNRVMPQNVVTGCTVMINRPLADIALPIPAEALMHDWWLALIAALFGQVVYLDEPTILYRQHGTNTVGTMGWGIRGAFNKIRNIQKVRSIMVGSIRQAQSLIDHYGEQMSPEQCNLVGTYASLLSRGRFSRIRTILKQRYFKNGTIRNTGFLLNMFFLRRQKFLKNHASLCRA